MRKRFGAAALLALVAACGPRSHEVGIRGNGAVLAGTIVLPTGRGPFPAVVFVHGDGPDTRRGYERLAKQYARRGVAALIYDKRGAGRSGGTFPAPFRQLADDAIAAIRFLRERRDIDAERIGLWGGSQGGWIAPLAAASPAARVRFIVIKAGPACSPAELARWKSVSRVERAGYPPEVAARVNGLMDLQFQIARSGSGWGELDAEMRALRGEPWLPLVAVMRHSSWRSSWMAYGRDIDFDPDRVLARVEAPILWLLGERDPETPLHATVARLEKWKAAGKNITVAVFRGADHQLELPRTAKNRPNYAPRYVETQIEWVLQQCEKGRP